MIICLNQHFICFSCAVIIASIISKCPFCQMAFDIKEINPRRKEVHLKYQNLDIIIEQINKVRVNYNNLVDKQI